MFLDQIIANTINPTQEFQAVADNKPKLVNPIGEGEFCQKLNNPSRDLQTIQTLAKHDFDVIMQPVTVGERRIPGKVIACKSTGEFLGNGVVSEGYKPMQPSELYDIANHLLSLDDTMTVTDIVTRSDSHMIGLQLNKGSWSPTGEFNDRIENNLVLFTTFDGSKPTSLRTVSFRPFCSNQYAATKHLFAIRHTAQADKRIFILKSLLNGVTREIAEANASIQSLVHKAMSKGQAINWFSKLYLTGDEREKLNGRAKTVHDNRLDVFEYLLSNGAGHEAGENTRYAAFNAVTNYCTHQRATRVTGQNGSEQEIRWESNLFGSSADFAQKAVNQLVTM